MNPRDTILNRIASAAGREAPALEAAYQAYSIAVSDASPGPRWTEPTAERFQQRLQAAAATCTALNDVSEIPGAIAAHLEQHGLAPRLHLAPHPLLEGLDWPADWQCHRGVETLADSRVTVTVARYGVAETGTLMIPGYPSTPPSFNLLAEHSVVVLNAGDIVDYQERAWAGLRAADPALPRAVMMVTGPSRTADIEQTLQLGAHGPRNLHVLLVNAGPTTG